MPKTLSMDLRERIVRHVREGHSRRSAAAKFTVSASSAVRIVARYLATGSVAPKAGGVGRRSRPDTQRDYLVRRIAEVPDITCIGLDLIGQVSDLGVVLRASDRSDQQATAMGWLC